MAEWKISRVANLHGGKGRSVPLDLVNEFINGDFKGTFIDMNILF